jgi:glycosyltransferase involved in cell wall biosynthesis
MTSPRVTAAVLTFNEERNIRRCLESLAWADEVVVVDSGSTDRTLEIARSLAHRVAHRPWSGFRAQRAAALAECTHEWVLFVDADEWIPEPLAREIRATLAAGTPHAGFWIRRRNRFLGRWIDHAWAPDRVLRLFRRDAGSFSGYEPHIHVDLPEGATAGTLAEPFLHHAYSSVSELLAKVNAYSTQFADADETDHLYSPARLILSPLVSVLKTLVLKRGFLDGARGLIIAWASGHYHFLKYAKKWEKLSHGRS